ncbi:MAG TPA: PKD domain-containing protein [Solirubrobacterales bacterium]
MRRLVLFCATAATLLALGGPAALAAPTWLPTATLPGSGPEARSPRVAMDAAGDAVVVWQTYDGSKHRLAASRRPAGGDWSAPVLISPPGVEATEADLVISATGEAIATWSTEFGEDHVEAATMAPGGGWSPSTQISGQSLYAGRARVAVDSAGNATAVWRQYNGAFYVIETARREPGGVWSPPTPVSSQFENSYEPDVAVGDHGDAAIVWVRGGTMVMGSERSEGGPWSKPLELSLSGASVGELSVAMNAAGEAVLIWDRSGAGGTYEIQSAALDHGIWRGAVNLSEGKYTYSPRVAIDAAGEALAVWGREMGFTEGDIEGATRPAGGSWGPAATLSPDDQQAENPELAMSPAGLAVLTWQGGPTFEESGHWAATRPAGAGWSAPHELAPPVPLGNYVPTATDAEGDAIAAWDSIDGVGGYQVEIAGFDGAGPRLSDVSIPGSGQAGAALHFSVRATDVWSPIAETLWRFGDGSTATGDAVVHAFDKAGVFPVSVATADALGNTTTADGGPVAVTDAPPPPDPKREVTRQGRARADGTALVRKGRAALRLTCVGGDCAGVAQLYAPPPAGDKGKGKKRRRPALVGEGSFRIAAGGHAAVKARLRPNALARLRRAPGLRLATTLRGTDIVPGKVVLHEAKRRHRRGHR